MNKYAAIFIVALSTVCSGILVALSIKDLIDNHKIFALKHIWIGPSGKYVDIDLSNMGLTNVDGFYYLLRDFSINPALIRNFDLSNNKIKLLPNDFLQKCIGLQRLFLNNNQFMNLPDQFLVQNTKLKELRLFNNFLISLPQKFLQTNSKLVAVGLSHNKIFQLPAKFLSQCLKLKVLWLHNNDLTALPKKFLVPNKNILYLTLHHNPFEDNILLPSYALQALMNKDALREVEECVWQELVYCVNNI